MYCAHDTAEHCGTTGLKTRQVVFCQVLVVLTKILFLFEVFQTVFCIPCVVSLPSSALSCKCYCNLSVGNYWQTPGSNRNDMAARCLGLNSPMCLCEDLYKYRRTSSSLTLIS